MRHAGTPPSSATHFGSGKVATKRNMRVDRHSGQELTLASRNQLKKGGRGGANWGRPGDELVEDVLSSADPAYDSCDELFESAFGRPRGGHVNYDWAGAHVSESDSSDMDEIEAAMFEDWMADYEKAADSLQDEGEAFFDLQEEEQ